MNNYDEEKILILSMLTLICVRLGIKQKEIRKTIDEIKKGMEK